MSSGTTIRKTSSLVRRAYFVDPRMVKKAARLLGAKSDAHAVRRLVSQFLDQQKFLKFMQKSAGTVKRGTFTA